MYGEVVAGVSAHRFEDALGALKHERGVAQDTDLGGDDLGRAGRDLQGRLPRGDGLRLPAGRARAADAGGAARSSSPGTRRGRRSTAARTGSRTTSARRSTSSRWSSATRATRPPPGVCFTRDPSTGRERPLRRVPRQRAGRGRRLGDPHARAARADAGAPARGLRAAHRHDAAARGALQGHAGHRVHDRGRPALPAPDAHGQADGRGGAEGGRDDGRRDADLARGGGRADRPGPARPAPAPDDRPDGGVRGGGARPERVARAPRPGRSSSTPTPPRSAARRGRTSCSSAGRRRPTTSTG